MAGLMSGSFDRSHSRPRARERGTFGVMQMHQRSSGTS